MIAAAVVSQTAVEAGQQHAVRRDGPTADPGCPAAVKIVRGARLRRRVVVAVHRVQRRVDLADQVVQVVARQVATADDQVRRAEPIPQAAAAVQPPIDLVGHGQNPHPPPHGGV